MTDLRDDISTCTLCADRFAATETAHAPRPVVWFAPGARILIAGQAPGMRVHQSGRPFTDPSGDRLRDWLGMDEDTFYDRSRVAIVPMAFCFPGYDAKGSDLPPPPICARTWRDAAMEMLAEVQLTLVIGGYAMKYHLGKKVAVTAAVQDWRSYDERLFVLPHPSWRNTGWLKKNPWFAAEVLPRLQARVAEVLA
ncbi:uracil-DNA glycosylase family protein [Roseobacter sp. A03A-229]